MECIHSYMCNIVCETEHCWRLSWDNALLLLGQHKGNVCAMLCMNNLHYVCVLIRIMQLCFVFNRQRFIKALYFYSLKKTTRALMNLFLVSLGVLQSFKNHAQTPRLRTRFRESSILLPQQFGYPSTQKLFFFNNRLLYD